MFRFNLVLMLALLVNVCCAAPTNPYAGRQYNRSNVYQGYINNSGAKYNRSNVYQGRVSSTGRVYNKSGVYQGRIK